MSPRLRRSVFRVGQNISDLGSIFRSPMSAMPLHLTFILAFHYSVCLLQRQHQPRVQSSAGRLEWSSA